MFLQEFMQLPQNPVTPTFSEIPEPTLEMQFYCARQLTELAAQSWMKSKIILRHQICQALIEIKQGKNRDSKVLGM